MAHTNSHGEFERVTVSENADPAELAKFSTLARTWWDPKGASRPLHDMNPLRLAYIRRHAEIAGREVLDVGCGGGILSESMAKCGGKVLGIDLSKAVLDVAELHALESQVSVTYQLIAAEALATDRAGQFDVVTCMELLEHVPSPDATVAALARLVKPGGDVFVSTLNRTPVAFAVAILGAEYIARVLPHGTHEYLKFIRPSELARWGRAAGLDIKDLSGIGYNPLTRAFRLSDNTNVNYLAHFKRLEPA
jgi:2-polyprenyl-6-hydroxyphenyl methylase/3-demethylubiquinone-9 3-methyltransferase